MGKTFRNHGDEIAYHTQMHRAFMEGKKAGEAGVDTTACPYRPGSEMLDEWFKGYSEGKK